MGEMSGFSMSRVHQSSLLVGLGYVQVRLLDTFRGRQV